MGGGHHGRGLGGVDRQVIAYVWRTPSRIGAGLVARAVRGARDAHCEWLHVDFDDKLRGFYLEACGFRETGAGLIAL